MMRWILIALAGLMTLPALAQEWQWSVPAPGGRNPDATAYLWIPEKTKQIRAVVVAQHNMEEISILEHRTFRRELAKMDVAEVWVAPGFDLQFRFNEGAGEILNKLLNDLAECSGYDELRYVPLAPLGHSAAASWPYYLAAWNPKRTLCCLSVSGQWPYFRDDKFAPPIWGDRKVDYIPCLETMGEYEAADSWSTEGLRQRQQYPLTPLSMLACPGEGHFASTETKAQYLALYLKKAMQYRLPARTTAGQAPVLIPVDPSRTGWLAEKWLRDRIPTTKSAPVGKYSGNPAEAFWFFDEEIVRATETYQARWRGKKPQLAGYMQDGNLVPQRNTHQQVDLAFRPLPDGSTFRLRGAWLDQVPGESPRPAAWTQRAVGTPLEHAVGKVRLTKITGPFEVLDDSTFRLKPERGLSSSDKPLALWFAAIHPGDDVYKPAVQQAQLLVPKRNTNGRPQVIHFPEIPDQRKSTRRIPVTVRADSEEPVQLTVLEGPARLEKGGLLLTRLPPRSRYPVRIRLLAWQYGIPGKWATAEPVERSFYLQP